MRGLRNFFLSENCGPAHREQPPPGQEQDREERAADRKRSLSDRTKEADLAAIKAQCQLNYAIASHPKFSGDPIVIAALASAKASEAALIAAVAEADAARGLRIWGAYRHVRQASETAGNAQVALRAAIEIADHEASQGRPGDQTATNMELWTYFRGKPNTKKLLQEKAEVVAALIMRSCDSTLSFAASFGDSNGNVRLAETEERQARAEIAAFLLTFVDRRAFNFLGSKDREIFMEALEAGVGAALRDRGMETGFIYELVSKRYEEYAPLPEWPENGESYSGTLFHEFTKKVAIIVRIGRNAIFDAYFTNGILKDLTNWRLNELLPPD